MRLTKYVKDWLVRAEDDVKIIEILLKEDGHGKHIRKVHDLNALLIECVKIDNSLESLQNASDYLNQLYLGVRYPGDASDFSLSEAKSGYKKVMEIQGQILNKLI